MAPSKNNLGSIERFEASVRNISNYYKSQKKKDISYSWTKDPTIGAKIVELKPRAKTIVNKRNANKIAFNTKKKIVEKAVRTLPNGNSQKNTFNLQLQNIQYNTNNAHNKLRLMSNAVSKHRGNMQYLKQFQNVEKERKNNEKKALNKAEQERKIALERKQNQANENRKLI